MFRVLRVLAALLALVVVTRAQAPRPPDSSATNIRLTLAEGTSMAAALSPDGQTIVIDLLGALWTLNAGGGQATRILDDGYDAHAPAWSPDGTRIAFQAYRDHTWNIWIINRDGTGLRRLTSGAFDDREPHWSPDGTRLAFSSDRSGNYDVWTIAVRTSDIQPLTTGSANEFAPAWSPDGREIAYVSDRLPRGIYAAALASRVERLLTSDTRTLAAPSWSADGTRVSYTAIAGARAELVVASVASSAPPGRPATTINLAAPDEDVFPFRATWATSGELLYTADGKIKTRPAAGGSARTVEFSADVAFPRAAFTPTARVLDPRQPQPVRGLMKPAISPDGSRIVFAALGDLWLAPALDGEVMPERLTNDAFIDTDPAWSPDGTRIAFSSDRDGSMDLWIRDLKSGADRKLAPRAMSAAWSPDGTRIAFLDPESQLQIADVASAQVSKAHDRLMEPSRPSWLPGGRAVVMGALRPYSTRFREGTNQILLVPIDVSPRQPARANAATDTWLNPLPHQSIGMREDQGPAWSPDGTQLAAIIEGRLTLLPIGAGGAPIGKPRRLSQELASTPSWTRDSRRVLYQHADGFALVTVANGSIRRITPRLSWSVPEVTGTTVVHAGRLFDGRNTAPRSDVDIVVSGNRITRIEPHRPDLHTGTVVDASRGTVLPGLIDSHTHLAKSYGEALGRIWLAFGITTVRNPAANPFEVLEDREAIDTGVRTGPRVVATGEPFDGTRIYYPGGASLDDQAQVDERMARAGRLGFDFIKTYVRLPDQLQQRVIEQAHRLGLPVTSHEIYPAVAYGADGVEHIRGTSRRGYSPKMSELRRSYEDVVALLAASKMTLTPTIVIQGGFPLLTRGDGWWLDDPRVQGLFPSTVLEAGRAIRTATGTPQDRADAAALVSPQERLAATLVQRGGRVIAGTDSPIFPYGVALLTELEHYVRGGMSAADAIRTATMVPAEAMGLGAELGTLEVGKLADLIVVDGNPLDDIRDLRNTRYTLKNGVVYERDALLRRP